MSSSWSPPSTPPRAAPGSTARCWARACPRTPTTSRSPSRPAAVSPPRCRTCWTTTDLKPSEVVHLNAHATSTPQGDVAELKALRKVLGDDLDHVAISATKSMTGHLLGGAGGIETVATVLALYHRMAPPTINVDEPRRGGRRGHRARRAAGAAGGDDRRDQQLVRLRRPQRGAGVPHASDPHRPAVRRSPPPRSTGRRASSARVSASPAFEARGPGSGRGAWGNRPAAGAPQTTWWSQRTGAPSPA